jgi:hypothetical protein
MDSGGILENVGVKKWNYFNILRRLLKQTLRRKQC